MNLNSIRREYLDALVELEWMTQDYKVYKK